MSVGAAALRAAQAVAAMHPVHLRQLCDAANAQGLSSAALLRRAGLEDADLERPVAVAAMVRVVEALHRDLERPILARELGLATAPTSHGPLGLLLASAPTLRVGLLDLQRYLPLRSAALRLELDEAQSRLSLQVAASLGAQERFFLEWGLASLLSLLSALLGTDASQLQLELPWSDGLAGWREALAARGMEPPRSGPTAAILLTAAELDQPQLTASAEDHRHALRTCSELERQHGTARAHLARLLALLLSGPTTHGFKQQAVARQLGLSVAELRRHLQVEGVRYEVLLEGSRRRQAWRLLRLSDLGMAEIASRLGYRDPSNFARCCRRWFGRTPSALRDAARQPAAS